MAREHPKYAIIDDDTDTSNIVAGPCRLGKLIVYTVGTSGDIKIYDATSGTSNLIYHWVTADGKINEEINIRMTTGLRVVVTNDPVAVITYDS